MHQSFKSQSASNQRLRGLDALRGLAALSVVLYHFTTVFDSHHGPYAPRPLFSFPNGHFGVELFFCISGFVILGTIERTGSLKRFAVARFARLYPAYFVCALITLAVIRFAPFSFPVWNTRTLAVGATMLSSFAGAQLIDPSYWTLSYEVLFYVGAALVWSLLPSPKRLEIPCLVWLACSFVGHLVPWFGLHHRLTVLLNIEYANLFVLGMMLYYISQNSLTRLTMPVLAAASLMTLFPPQYNGAHLPQTAYVAMIACFGVAIWGVTRTSGRFLNVQPLVFLGEISYSLYLIHQVAGYAMIRSLLRAGVSTNMAILVTIAFMIGVAFALRTSVEKPAERFIKNLARPKLKKSETHASRPAHLGMGA